MHKYQKKSTQTGLKSAAVDTAPKGAHLVDNRTENVQRKVNSSNVAQLAKVTRTKGNIIDSVQINPDGAKAKDGKTHRGQISGGVANKGGTPGTPYAKNVKKTTGTEDWLGGHIYKHQWGGNATGGNVVVWPDAAEKEWATKFENPVQDAIDRGERSAIGVSWTSDDDLISQATVNGIVNHQVPGGATPKKTFVSKSAELARRDANEDLSYIPTLVAGSFNGRPTMIPGSLTHSATAATDAEKILNTKIIPKLVGDYDRDNAKDFFASRSAQVDARHATGDDHEKTEKLKGEKAKEDAHKGSFGNVEMDRGGVKIR